MSKLSSPGQGVAPSITAPLLSGSSLSCKMCDKLSDLCEISFWETSLSLKLAPGL